MKHRFFKIPVDGGPAEAEMNAFVAAHRVLAVERQFVGNGSSSKQDRRIRIDPTPVLLWGDEPRAKRKGPRPC